jgi:Protein of unknown function (DUF1566)
MLFNKFIVASIFAASLSAYADTPFTLSPNGLEIVDTKTGLIWRRCAEGMSAVNNSCLGTANRYTHEAALSHANSQAGWRLPNIQELSSLIDINRQNPAVDTVAFPVTPVGEFWSSTPRRNNTAFGVLFDFGEVWSLARSATGYVRLVRAGQ